LWLLLSTITGLLMAGEPLTSLIEDMAPFLEWRLLTGLWLYGLVAGVAYAIRIRQALAEQQRAAAEARALAVQAQLDSLRARLNPHFLFNALHALSGLIHQDPARADDALERIGTLLRRTLATDGVRPVPLRDEWDFASEYLDLERLRLGDRLTLATSIAADTEDCLIPSFTIQPLVENAVQHAVAPRLEGATITVETSRANGRLRIRVSDDGPGLGTHHAESDGHGLDLLRRRLSAFYGDRARLTLTERRAAGCDAVVELPAQDAP
jgi:LytS/YehU family sensor histidine kinase